MRTSTRILIFATAWAIVLMPFLFWRSTWFGRPLTDSEITEYLRDNSKPRHVQHALVQIGERIQRAQQRGGRPGFELDLQQWYPDVVRLASHPVEEIRNTDAWILGQLSPEAAKHPEFHEALLRLLADSSMNVRSNAALSLVTYGDAAGHDQIVAMLQPTTVTAPAAGEIRAAAKPGEPIRNSTMVAQIASGGSVQDVRSPITGKVERLAVKVGDNVIAGAPLAVINPGPDQAWEALRALYVVGRNEDLPLVRSYQAKGAELGDRVRQQAVETEKAILRRRSAQPL
jgi:hypothetical protein